jgi:protein TonB
MANEKVFSQRQWATAFTIAAALHALLACSLLTSEPTPPDRSAEQEGGLSVQSLSLNSADLRVLQDARNPAHLAMVEPPTLRSMTEIVPIEPKPKIENAKPKPKQQPLEKAKESHPPREPAARDAEYKNRAATGKGDSTAKSGSDRAAAPVISNPHPLYPPLARSRGHEGRVLIRVSVLGDGRVGSATVAKSSGHGSLDRAALKAVRRWRFKPALRAGRPVAATLTVPVVFRLKG